MKISRVDTPYCVIGEAPMWDAAAQALFFIDTVGQKVHRYDPSARTTRTWTAPARLGGLVLRDGGGLLLALHEALYTLNLETDACEMLVKPASFPANARFNDGKVDARGRFVVGSGDKDHTNPQSIGSLFSLGADHVLTVHDSGIATSNGPCWSPDGKTLYFSDSHHHTTFAYDYDPDSGRPSNKRVFLETHDFGGVPDGMTVDRDGLVWIALPFGGKVAAFRPDGKVERVIAMPVPLPSSVMFGGPNLDQLYVTTIDFSRFGGDKVEGAGHLHVIEGLGTRGLPEPAYKG